MQPIREVYPCLAEDEEKYGRFYGPGDYGALINSMGFETLLQVDDSDYQGDSRLILRDGNRYGMLIFGWGSCSGCDALQACESFKEIEELRESLFNSILWYDSKEELHAFIRDRDWDLQYSWHEQETKDFVEQALVLLGSND